MISYFRQEEHFGSDFCTYSVTHFCRVSKVDPQLIQKKRSLAKLQPRVTADLVQRPRLKEALNVGLDHPLILVAAPAGFGTSTLVSAGLVTSLNFAGAMTLPFVLLGSIVLTLILIPTARVLGRRGEAAAFE